MRKKILFIGSAFLWLMQENISLALSSDPQFEMGQEIQKSAQDITPPTPNRRPERPSSTAGHPIMNRGSLDRNNPTEDFARRVEESLRISPQGFKIIRGSACTTPKHVLGMIQRQHPSTGLTQVTELPAFIRQLFAENAPEGKWRMARTVGRAGGECKLDLAGWARPFDSGEQAFYHPNLGEGEPIFAGSCTNGVGERIDKPAQTPRPTPAPQSDMCPGGQLHYNAWPADVVTAIPGVSALIEQTKREPWFEGDRFSRTYGQLLAQKFEQGYYQRGSEFPRSTVPHNVRISVIRAEEGVPYPRIFAEREFGTYSVGTGLRTFNFTADDFLIQGKKATHIRIVLPNNQNVAVETPVRFDGTGEREIRFSIGTFLPTWRCTSSVHSAIKARR